MQDAEKPRSKIVDLDSPHSKFRISARTMLMLDWAGAWLTACSICSLLATEIIPTGIPTSLLISMATAAFGFGVVDGVGLIFFRDPRRSLQLIAILNLAYCFFSIGVCLFHTATLTSLGIVYFAVEIAIIIPLSIVEWRIASQSH